MTEKSILTYIRRAGVAIARRARLQAYYDGKSAILRRAMADTSKPNHRLVCGFPALIANSYTGYMFGEPVAYDGDDTGLLAELERVFAYNDEQAENSILGLDCAICGQAVEILYIDADGEVRFQRVDPAGCIAIYGQDIKEALEALIRVYDVYDVERDRTFKRVEVLDGEKRYVYAADDMLSGLCLEGEEPHAFGDVPAVVYKNNGSAAGDFEGVLSLIDAYELMQSDTLNDREYFSDAYLALKGLEGTQPEDVADMKSRRVLLLPPDGDAQWLLKQGDGAGDEAMKTRLNHDIHRFSGCPDMSDENFAGNASGVALRYKLLQFENIAGIKEREFKRGLQRRIELLCNIFAVLGRPMYDWRSVRATFKRALPQNLLELSQTLSNLGTLLSDETKRALLPLEIDEAAEAERIAGQRESNMSLFSFSHEDEDDGGGAGVDGA